MSHGRDSRNQDIPSVTTVSGSEAGPGKQTLVAPVQWCVAEGAVQRAAEGGDTSAHTQQVAQQGVSGAGGPLPHRDRILSLFGPTHDVSHVQAHVGGEAATASAAIGARAYTTGNQIAFA